jgi:hypothetical protein
VLALAVPPFGSGAVTTPATASTIGRLWLIA